MNRTNKDILRLSLPAIVSNITVPLLGLCDTAISGHLGADIFLAAIAVGSVMLNVVFWLFGFLRMGTTGITAQAYGAQDEPGIRKVFSRSFFLAFAAGIILILARYPLFDSLSAIVGADKNVDEFVEQYFLIRIWGAPALLGVMAVSGWLVGMQSTFYPMVIAIAVNIINIAASFLLVFSAEMGFAGVAWGTLISNWTGLVIALGCVIWMRRGKRIWCSCRDLFRDKGWGSFFSVNSNLFVRSACIICVTMGVTAAGAKLGALTLAVNVVVMQFFQFFSFFMDGFAFSGEALIGKWTGARNLEKVHEYFKALMLWTLGVAVVFTVLYFTSTGAVAALLTDSERVRAGVDSMVIWISLIPIVSAWAFIYDGFFVGLTDTRKMMIATMGATILFFIIVFLRLDNGKLSVCVENNFRIWSAFLSYLMMRGLILALMWKSSLQKRMNCNV
ncbi:MAG: MATE family efflux transporter [Muribaculaceae bacterium]|nr:MATE family efflux transporter [Muribaculaceae bacterium]